MMKPYQPAQAIQTSEHVTERIVKMTAILTSTIREKAHIESDPTMAGTSRIPVALEVLNNDAEKALRHQLAAAQVEIDHRRSENKKAAALGIHAAPYLGEVSEQIERDQEAISEIKQHITGCLAQ